MKRKQEDGSGVEEVEEEKKETLEPESKRQKVDDRNQSKEQLYLERLKLSSFDALNELSESRRDCPKCN